MQVTLRKAIRLRDEMAAILKNKKIEVVKDLNTHGDFAKQTEAAIAGMQEQLIAKVKLTEALYELRQAVAAANAKAGVDSLLNEIKKNESLLTLKSALVNQTQGSATNDLQIAKSTFESHKARANSDSDRYLFRDNVSVCLVSNEMIQALESEVKELKRQVVRQKDELLNINAANTITLSANVISVATGEGLV